MPISGINLNKILSKINKSLEAKGLSDISKVAELLVKLDKAKTRVDNLEADLNTKLEKVETDINTNENNILINKDKIETKEDKK